MASFFGSRTPRPLARIAAAGLIALGLASAGLTGSALAQTAAPAAPAAKPAAPAAAKPAMPAPAATTPAAPLLDINSATKEELSALKGIGAVRSEAIIKGRPYKGKDDLVRKNIIPEGVYADIKDQIIAKQK